MAGVGLLNGFPRYILRRLLAAIPLLWLVWTLTFVLARALPGDPASLYIGPDVTPEAVERLRRVHGLDDPMALQYVKQLWATVTGDLARSTAQNRPVSDVVLEAVGPTLLLVGGAILLQAALGLLLGGLSAWRQDRPLDHAVGGLSLLLYSIPTFLIGLELTLLFSYHLGWLPPSHMRSVRPPEGTAGLLVDRLRHLALPLTTLVLGGSALTIRHVRSSLLEVMDLDFVRTARARGLSEWRVLGRHALRNALLPLITLLGLFLPVLFSGVLVVEVIFSWPGLGQVTYNAIQARDYPVVQATTLLTAAFVIAGSLLSDLLSALVDPRIRQRDPA